MANVVVDLQNEIWRVRKILPRLAGARLAEAQELIRFAETSMAMNKVEYMKEALAELLEVDVPEAPRRI